MNEKLNIQDIVRLLAERNGITKKDSEAFVKEFFLLIEEGLEKDNYVKIKGLGTFRLTEVGSRESVNVNTGERFRIEGHTKVSFTPESSLKEIINKPFAHFETVVLNENTVLDDTPVEAVNEESDEPLTASEDVEKKTAEEEISEVSAEEIIAAEVQKAEQMAAVTEKVVEEPVKPAAVADVIEKKSSDKAKVDKSAVTYLVGIIVTVLLFCGGALIYVYYPGLFSSGKKGRSIEVKEPVANVPVTPAAPLDTVKADTIAETTMAKKPEVPSEKKPVQTVATVRQPRALLPVEPDSVNYTIIGTKTMYTIKEGETLTRVSLRFYGTKDLWPYIVKHNRNIIKNPDRVPYGTTLKIPELAKK